MFSLTIAFGSGSWAFLFRSKDKAKAAMADTLSPAPGVSVIEDDFGQIATIARSDMKGVLFEDLNLTKDAAVERSLYTARGQADLNRRASSDPALKLASGGGMFGANGMPHRMNG
jgi:hypothetical protein